MRLRLVKIDLPRGPASDGVACWQYPNRSGRGSLFQAQATWVLYWVLERR